MSFEDWFRELEEIIRELLGIKARDMEEGWLTYWEDAYREEKRSLRVALDTAELWATVNPEIRKILQSGSFSERLEDLIRQRGEESEENSILPSAAWPSLGEDSRTDLGILFSSHIFIVLEEQGLIDLPHDDMTDFILAVVEGIKQAWELDGFYVGSIVKRELNRFPNSQSWSVWKKYELSQDPKTRFVKLTELLDRIAFLSEYGLWFLAWDPQVETAVQTLERRLLYLSPMAIEEEDLSALSSGEEPSSEEIEAYLEAERERVPVPFQDLLNDMRGRTIELMTRLFHLSDLHIKEDDPLDVLGDEQIEAAINVLLMRLPNRPGFLDSEEG